VLASALTLLSASAALAATLTVSQTTFASQSPTPTFSVSMAQADPGGTATGSVDVRTMTVDASYTGFSSGVWSVNTTNFPQCTIGSGRTAAQCGLTVEVGGTDVSTAITVTVAAPTDRRQFVIAFPAAGTAGYDRGWSAVGTVFKVTFANGLWNTAAAGGPGIEMTLRGLSCTTGPCGTGSATTGWAGPANVEYGSRVLSVNSTVTFDANGGAGSMTPQSSKFSGALTANSFTRSGYTFGGWATSQSAASAGTVAYADAASYNFTSGGTRTLYAIWTPTGGGSGGGSSNTPSSATLATTGGDGFPAALAALGLGAAGLGLLALRRRSASS